MMSSDQNKRLFHRDLMLRDNGVITIGSYIRVLAPLPIDRNMTGIPMIRTFFPVIAMERPAEVHLIILNSYIEANQSGVAILNDAILTITRTTPIQTTCTGKHCDKQRPLDWTNTPNRGCGCWGTTSIGTSNIALMHNLRVEYGRNNVITMNNFSSSKFNTLFMDGPLPPNTNVSSLEQTESAFVLEDAIENCVNYINQHDGFQVVLWFSRGEINDQSLVGLNAQEEAQVDAGRLNYHIIEILPMDFDILDRNTLFGRSLNRLKFRIGSDLVNFGLE